MKCTYCGKEHSQATCPGCGAPANAQPGAQPAQPVSPKKRKKPLLKRWWFWAIAVIVLIIIIANLNKGNQNNGGVQPSATGGQIQSTASQSGPAVQQTEESTPSTAPTEDLTSVEKVHVLKNGHYVAGIDIPAGKCNVTAVEGKGNLNSSNLINGGINEMFGVDDTTDLYTKSFNGLKLPKGTILNVSGGLTIQLEFTAIDSGFTGRTYDEANAITLETGNYEADVDFKAGVYKIVALSGAGNLSSSNIMEGGVNEMFGVDNTSGLYTSEFTNVDLPKGTELSVVGGLSIQLIPAIEK